MDAVGNSSDGTQSIMGMNPWFIGLVVLFILVVLYAAYKKRKK